MAERAHDHGHVDWSVHGPELIQGAEVFAPMVDQALGWLAGRVPNARSALDVGAGPGVAACRLAQLLPEATVLAVDGEQQLLTLATQRAAATGVSRRFTTRSVRLPEDLADLPKVDLIWVSSVLHHLPDAVKALQLLGNLLNSGGVLGVAEGGLPLRFLPDGLYPGLLSRIEAASEAAIAANRDRLGVYAHTGAWPDLMRAAGLEYAGSRTFLLDLPAPLADGPRAFITERLSMARDRLAGELDAADQAALTELVEGDTMRRRDLFMLFGSTVHTAVGS